MLKTLIKKQMLELFQTYFVNNKTGKARSKVGTALFFGLFVLLFGGLGIVFYLMDFYYSYNPSTFVKKVPQCDTYF